MQTQRFAVGSTAELDALARATIARLLAAGGIVAFPTESFYGLAASPWDTLAIERLLALKGARDGKPVPLVIASTGAALRVASDIPRTLDALAARHWPGPLTLVLPAHPELAAGVTAGTGTVGVRVPGLALARELARLGQGAVTATSANPSGAPPPCTAAAVLACFDGAIDALIDGGDTAGGMPSTVIDLTRTPARLLRAGAIARETLSRDLELG